jgi:hypothetical protein
MVNADQISKSISPGSTEYGDRQVVGDRIAQVMQQTKKPATSPPGAASQGGLDKLKAGPVSDLPVTSGLSVGPGAGATLDPMANMPEVEKLRILATNGRSPRMRALARDALRAKALGY